MLEIDATDEAVLDADPDTVFKAIADMYAGRARWWSSRLEAKPRAGIGTDQVGGMCDITIHGPPTLRFTTKTEEVILGRLIRVAYVEGAYRGEGIWTFEPIGGKTRLRFRFHVRPHGLIRLLLRFRPREAKEATTHHKVTKAGFEGLERYLQGTKEDAT